MKQADMFEGENLDAKLPDKAPAAGRMHDRRQTNFFEKIDGAPYTEEYCWDVIETDRYLWDIRAWEFLKDRDEIRYAIEQVKQGKTPFNAGQVAHVIRVLFRWYEPDIEKIVDAMISNPHVTYEHRITKCFGQSRACPIWNLTRSYGETHCTTRCNDGEDIEMPPGLFALGEIMATPTIAELVHPDDRKWLLYRHVHGDWGIVDDPEENAKAVKSGARILSVYEYDGREIWLLTNAEDDDGIRDATTFMLPEEN